jgi:alcohol dehydrogenase class IV
MDIVNIRFYSLVELRRLLDNLPFKAPILIISQSAENRWGLTDCLRKFVAERPCTRRIDNPQPNPTLGYIAGLLRNQAERDGIIAIGGGSVIDLGKALNAFRRLENPTAAELRSAIQARDYSGGTPLIAVPSTAGAGSETTSWATVWDDENHVKYSLDSAAITPAQAWIVPELTYTAPLRLTLSAGLDAVCHASEAYWARATDSLTQNIALRALALLTVSLPDLCRDLSLRPLRDQMVQGALLAGLAFSRTRTTACHSISYPLTSLFRVEHGLAAAMTLAQIADINARQVDLREYFAVFAPFGGVRSWVDQVCGELAPLRLGAFGIKAEDLDTVAALACTPGRIDNNPAQLSQQEVKRILSDIL